jgi:hypothetical protein
MKSRTKVRIKFQVNFVHEKSHFISDNKREERKDEEFRVYMKCHGILN